MDRARNGNPPRKPERPLVSRNAAIVLLILLMFPGAAVWRLAQRIDPRWVAAYFVLMFAATYLFYRHDKKRAVTGGWRTPESTLHALELLGGWPSAFLAQRVLRHKISKVSYQVVFWLIVVLHEFVSFDFLQGWRYSRMVFALF